MEKERTHTKVYSDAQVIDKNTPGLGLCVLGDAVFVGVPGSRLAVLQPERSDRYTNRVLDAFEANDIDLYGFTLGSVSYNFYPPITDKFANNNAVETFLAMYKSGRPFSLQSDIPSNEKRHLSSHPDNPLSGISRRHIRNVQYFASLSHAETSLTGAQKEWLQASTDKNIVFAANTALHSCRNHDCPIYLFGGANAVTEVFGQSDSYQLLKEAAGNGLEILVLVRSGFDSNERMHLSRFAAGLNAVRADSCKVRVLPENEGTSLRDALKNWPIAH